VFLQLVYVVVRTLYASSLKGDRFKVAIIDGLSELPAMRLTHFIFYEKKYMWERDGDFCL